MKRGQSFVLTGFSLVVAATFATTACAVGADNNADDSTDDASTAAVDRATPAKADTGVRSTEDATVPVEDAAGDTASTAPDAGIKDSGVKDSSSMDSGVDSGVDSGSSSDAAPAKGCAAIRINEVQVGGAASAADEFVELYNTSATDAVSTAGCKLGYRSKSGTSDIDCFTATISIPPLGFAVLGGGSFGGATAGTLSCGGLAGAGGQLAFFSGSTRVDSMTYGPISATPNFTQGNASAPLPADGQSVGRTPDGHDTHNTGADFVLFIKPTPGAANQ